MKVGDLVKWLGEDGYGEMGVVVDVYSNGNFQIYWIKDDYLANHSKYTGGVEVVEQASSPIIRSKL